MTVQDVGRCAAPGCNYEATALVDLVPVCVQHMVKEDRKMTISRGPGRPKRGYRTKDGTKVPSVTDILRRYKESQGLLWWAWGQGKKGNPLNQKRDAAADMGKLIHSCIEEHICGDRDGWGSVVEEASHDVRPHLIKAVEAFLAWEEERSPVYVAIEWPFVSEEYSYGGTFDLVCEVEGELGVVDWKTSKAHYPEMVIQAGGYRQLYRENTKSGRDLVWAEVVLLPRGDNGIETFVPWRIEGENFDQCEAQFKALRECYRTDKEISAWFEAR